MASQYTKNTKIKTLQLGRMQRNEATLFELMHLRNSLLRKIEYITTDEGIAYLKRLESAIDSEALIYLTTTLK